MTVAASTATLRNRTRVRGCSNCNRRKKRIQAQLARTGLSRTPSSVVAGHQEGDVDARAQINDVFLTGVAINRQLVNPGERVFVDYTIRIDPDALSRFFDPDLCDLGFFQAGFRIEHEVRLGGEVIGSGSDCYGSDTSFEADFPAPSTPGVYTVNVEATGGNSGNNLGQESVTVEVVDPSENGGGGGTGPGNGNGNGNGNGGGDCGLADILNPLNTECGVGDAGAGHGAVAVLAILILVGLVN